MLRLEHKPHNGGARDGKSEMSLGMSSAVVGMERMVDGRVARSQSLAVAGLDDGHVVGRRSPHGDHLAAGRRRQRRLSRLLLLPRLRRTQERIDRHAVGRTAAAGFALARTCPVGDRRFAYQAVWAQGRRGRPGEAGLNPPVAASQPDAGACRSTVFVRPHLGDDFVVAEASGVGLVGVAAASHAVRSPENHGCDSQVAPLAAICHQAAIGGAAGRVDRSSAEKSGKSGLDRHRRRLHQTPVLEACVEKWRHNRRSPAQGRRPARLAAEVEEGPTPWSRPTSQVWQAQTQSGQARWAEGRLAKRQLHGLWQSGHQDLQNLSGDLSAGGRRHSRGAGEGRSWLVRLLLYRSTCRRRRNSRNIRRPRDHRAGPLPHQSGTM